MRGNAAGARVAVVNPLLDLAAEKALPRRFTAEPPTGFGPLLPTDSLVPIPFSSERPAPAPSGTGRTSEGA